MNSETVFDSMGVPMDSNCHGGTGCCDFVIRNENHHRSKCLSSDIQIEERKDHVRLAE